MISFHFQKSPQMTEVRTSLYFGDANYFSVVLVFQFILFTTWSSQEMLQQEGYSFPSLDEREILQLVKEQLCDFPKFRAAL